MQTITFATSNSGKVATLERWCRVAGLDVDIMQSALDLIEPQADTAEEVTQVKARQAYEQLQQTVLVDDSSFHIAALNGFPGVYIKPMLQTVGIQGILRLMESMDDRSAYFTSALVYIDAAGTERVFADDPYTGVIATEITATDSGDNWSELSKIFIPTGSTQALAELTHDQRHKLQTTRKDSYQKFAEWLKVQG